MYYQNYEDYMRTVLGYPVERRQEYIPIEQNYNFETRLTNTKELESYYPEIYRILNPIVCEVCNKYKGNCTKENIDMMVNEVYKKVNLSNEINIKINLDNRIQEKEINRNSISKKNNEIDRQVRQNNPFLNDLIRILLLNQILGGGGFFPGRPPVRPPMPPIRPPFPGGGNQRPPIIRDREYDEYIN